MFMYDSNGQEVSQQRQAAHIGSYRRTIEQSPLHCQHLSTYLHPQVAHGRHVKFLLMGRGWNVAMQPWAFPIVYRVLSIIHPRTDARRKQQTSGEIDDFDPSSLLLLQVTLTPSLCFFPSLSLSGCIQRILIVRAQETVMILEMRSKQVIWTFYSISRI